MPKLLLRRWLISLAILALLMNAFAPSISQALAAQASPSNGSWAEVCSSQGTRWVQLEPGDTDSVPEPPGVVKHQAACDYCLTHAASFALPPPAGAGPPARFDAATRLTLAEPGPAPGLSRSWASPAVRAPPAVC
ncbi:hypothetical protein DBR47_23900 [Paucibacter sp. KBW04]|uniref:DUF2946 domain-containing protein n=1 Tax=Paucibacter sp. KBW04 TaxID=2153361 RepID=UPI000F567872|nr:DUF2946 domain-containing protein [Paucibacter sp. KBW04]RQO53467.1 hypothetical protein DBR47_23900 [Paucibacter sp. KBW04]